MPHPERDQQPWTDEIVAEVRAAREQLLAACDHDLGKLVERLRATQDASARAIGDVSEAQALATGSA